MITHDNITPGQAKWLALIQYYFAEVYSRGIITHVELTESHKKFHELRALDKKYKVGWPIWLIVNNSIARGVYELPIQGNVTIEDDVPKTSQQIDFESELTEFGIDI